MTSLFLWLLLSAGQWGEVVEVRYVLFSAVVTDRYGKPVTHLRSGDFSLWVDLNEAPMEHFSHDFSAPVSTLFLVDDSGSMSMGRRPDAVKDYLRRFLVFWREGDEFALATFRDRETTLDIPFPGSKRAFFDRLKTLEPRGQTALYDALPRVSEWVGEGTNDRKQIILITDSHDNFSSVEPGTAIHLLQELEVPVHVICIPLSPKEPLDIKFLLSLSRFTGGTLHVMKEADDVGTVVSTIINLVHHQYLLGFAPDTEKEVNYHRVQIDVRGRYQVITREGYRGYPPRYH